MSAPKGFKNYNRPVQMAINGTDGGFAVLSATIADEPLNDPIRILVQKKDAVTGQTTNMAGAEFTVKYYSGYYYSESELNGKTPTRKWILKTDSDGYCRLADEYRAESDFGEDFYLRSSGDVTLPLGTFTVQETKAPTGFVLDENVYAVSIEENGKTYTVENKAGVGFINAAQKGSLKIVKTSSDGKVEGFSFRVTGVDYDQTFKTDKNGEIVIEGLRIGDYTVSEVSDKASAGYILPADKQVTVKVNATAIVQMHNEFRDTPKTGDNFNLGLWVSLAALSVVGAGVLGFVGYKNRKKKKED